MEPYVCSECGKRLEIHHQTVMKNDKVYCKHCYHTYTSTGISDTPLFDQRNPWNKKPEPSFFWNKIFVPLFVFLILSMVVLAVFAPSILQGFFFKECTQNLKSWTCATTKPLYCENGKMVNRSDICGCDDGFRKYLNNSCISIINCTDGSLSPDCSQNKPYQCLNGSLMENASICGCPEGFMPSNDTCIKIQRCTDGTIYGQCSKNQPLFCENGALFERASVCGCPEGLAIESVGNTNGERCIINRNINTQKPTISEPANLYNIESQIHSLINEQRSANGLSALNFDEALASIARKHSQDMASRAYFSHYDPEGHNFYWRMQQDGYNCAILIGNTIYQGAENIYEESGYPTTSIASNTVDSWMTSQGHRENILTSYWRNEGIGVAKSSSGEVYVTQVFC